MKRTLTLVLLFLSLGGFAQSSIFAVVDGNNVTLWQTNTERNCGSQHGAVIILENNHINWYQVDTGGVANCFCIFNLSVTLDPLPAGEYTADVYGIERVDPTDTVYQGSTSFVISSRSRADTLIVQHVFQSECGATYLPEISLRETSITIQPNPFSETADITISANRAANGLQLDIYTLTGEKVWSITGINAGGETVKWAGKDYQGRTLPKGIYFCQLTTAGGRLLGTVKAVKL